MWDFIVAFILLTAGHRAQSNDNNLRGILHHTCPDNHVVSQINSSYSQTDQDRLWNIECKAFGSTSECSWSTFQDLYDKELRYNCPPNHVVAGFFSQYNKAHGDRSWKLLCCSASQFTTFECRETPTINYWNEDFTWQVPAGHFLTGVQTHSKKDTNGDHCWSFNYCRGTTQDHPTEDRLMHFMKRDVHVRNKRNARICKACRWSKRHHMVEVPYSLSEDFTSSERDTFEDAISEFHVSTCIRFVAHKHQRDYIRIVKKGGCSSLVGRMGGAQRLNLGKGCITLGIIQHELIHTLGFWHEQSRYDRDAYVKINFKNVKKGRRDNFKKFKTNNLNVPYDYSSVMHYSPKTFSKNSKDTIVPIDPSAHIGQRVGMSEMDILKINKLYECRNYLNKRNHWDNELKKAFCRTCPSGQAVSGITSHYSTTKKDRLWEFSCKEFRETRACKWSSYVNQHRERMDFKCGNNEVIAGAHSVYSHHYHDRKWRFNCCSVPDFTASGCEEMTSVNDLGGNFHWTVGSDYFLTGVKSVFDSEKSDRLWSLTYCLQSIS